MATAFTWRSSIAALRNFDVEAFYDFTGNLTLDVSSPSTPYDEYGDGTHVAGLIANDVKHRSGRRGEQIYQGIAPRADLIGLKVLDGNGQGSQAT
jgi:subtilisin family serine protease